MITQVAYRAAQAGMVTGVLLAIARISGETAPLLFTALNNQFWSTNLNAPMANLPVVIFQFALSPYEDWQKLAWAGALHHHAHRPRAQHHRARALPHRENSHERRIVAAYRRRPDGRARRRSTAPDLTEKISIRDLDFFYGDSRALKGISLPLYDSKVTAFIGPSGCGKSTLLRVLNRMYDLYPNQRADGRGACSTARISCRRSRTSTCCARASAWCSRSRRRSRCRSTRTSPSASGSTRSCRSPSSTAASSSALRRAALWDEVKDKLDANGLSLSGGQQQRLCIARTVAVKPEVILLDEPCSALDPISTAKIEELIDELKTDYTIVIVTHNMQQAARVSDFTAFMYLGELIEFDTTSKIFTAPERPADPGLHHRPLRLTGRGSGKDNDNDERTHRQGLRRRSPGPRPHGRRDGRPGREADRRFASMRWPSATPSCAERVIAADAAIDALQREIEEQAVLTIARRQPMAVDLREIVGALRIANDLERIGDLAKNIAKRVMRAHRRFPSAEADPRRRAHGRAGARPAQAGARRLRQPRRRQGAGGLEAATRRSTPCAPRCSASCSPT